MNDPHLNTLLTPLISGYPKWQMVLVDDLKEIDNVSVRRDYVMSTPVLIKDWLLLPPKYVIWKLYAQEEHDALFIHVGLSRDFAHFKITFETDHSKKLQEIFKMRHQIQIKHFLSYPMNLFAYQNNSTSLRKIVEEVNLVMMDLCDDKENLFLQRSDKFIGNNGDAN